MWFIWGLIGMFLIVFAVVVLAGAVWYAILSLFGFDLDKDEENSKGDKR